MFNAALGWAFVISFAASPVGNLLAMLFAADGLQGIPPYQAALFRIFSNYWLPALLIYLVLRFVRAERFLAPTKGMHLLFGIANLLWTSFTLLRVYVATVVGGGATFAVSIVAPIVLILSWWAIVGGTVWLVVRSLRLQSEHVGSVSVSKPVLATSSCILAILMLVPPFGFFGWLYASNADNIKVASHVRDAKADRFESLCKGMHIDIKKIATDTKSAYFPQGKGFETGLANRIEFVEVKLDPTIRFDGRPYVRLVGKGVQQGSWGRTYDVTRTTVTEVTAQYEVSIKATGGKALQDEGFYVEEATILDRRSGEVLADFTNVNRNAYSVVRKASDYCPRIAEFADYQSDLVWYILGLLEPSSAAKIAAKIEKFQKSGR